MEFGFHMNYPIFKLRVDTCIQLISSHRTKDWLTNLVTGDEKWVLYVNYTRKKQWLGAKDPGVPTPKPELHPEKVMLCVWWNVHGVIHWELLPTGATINASVYCQQLDRLAEKLNKKQDKVYFLHDNARPHIAKLTNLKLLQLGWTVLSHPPNSPDLAPTDYHLFRSLSNDLKDRKFIEEDDLYKYISIFFNNKPKDFYEAGIHSLPLRWQQVVDSDGAYINDL